VSIEAAVDDDFYLAADDTDPPEQQESAQNQVQEMNNQIQNPSDEMMTTYKSFT
jgi:hypothetical protein